MTANATGAQPIRPSYQASMLGFHAKLEILLRGQLQDEVAVTKTGG